MSYNQKEQKKCIGDYILLEVLGKGQYGTVYKAKRYKNPQLIESCIAIKKIDRYLYGNNMQNAYEQEKQIQISLNMHPNIVKTFEIIASTNNYYIVMEFCNGGNLKQYCEQFNNKLDQKRAQIFAAQIISGLKFLRDNQVMHRDIKPENILIDYQSGDIILKISDFGLSKSLQGQESTQTLCGTPLYSSPEIFNNQEYDYKSDL